MSDILKLLNSPIPVGYPEAMDFMNKKVKEIIENNEIGYLWFLEHPSIYTAGTGANEDELLDPKRFPTYSTGRGGKYTYHGPGQQVIYIMLNLKRVQDKPDIKRFIHDLEKTIIITLKEFGIRGKRKIGKIGVWVQHEEEESKIAFIGIRVKQWVTYHGIAININPNLEHFSSIVPCGIPDADITSFKKLTGNIDISRLDKIFVDHFCRIFNIKESRFIL
jgi:lipoyl(octanoyl) transferase